MSTHRSRRRRSPSLFWPLILIGAGTIFLLVNFGYLQAENVWAILWRFWPVLLILVGIDVLFGSRSLIGAVISAMLGIGVIAAVIALIWFAPSIDALKNLTTPVALHSERVSAPVDDITEARVVIDVGRADFTLDQLKESASLIEADVTHSGVLDFEVNRRGDSAEVKLDINRPNPGTWFVDKRETWDVGLSGDVLYEIRLDAGSGAYDIDFSGLKVADLNLDLGSGRSSFSLPSSGSVVCTIDAGSGDLDMVLPEGMGARIRLDSGSGDFRPDSRFKLVRGREDSDSTWETDNYGTAADGISMEIDQGSGDITIR
ncbi:MAG TPA: DUF5668 domain-containing protein [Anaerolineae bacterium]|nr:DUF5668 domain-containing protein [Anaerolineae bacterium]